MSLYMIFYEYADKKGSIRNRRVMCNGNDMVVEKYKEITESITQKPITEPRVHLAYGYDQVGERVKVSDIMGGTKK